MRCCVIIPTYENLSTLPAILDDCDAANLPVIVVDDGSTDGTAEAIRTWLDQGENRWSITMKVNGGKGAALAAGLAEASRHGFAGAVTVDADGQHLTKMRLLCFRVGHLANSCLVRAMKPRRIIPCRVSSAGDCGLLAFVR